jgi:outer membrane receptor protein involved in Fe transport
LSYRIRSRKKPGRSLSVIGSLTQTNNNTTGFLFSIDKFYHAGGLLLSSDTIDERKIFSSQGTTMYANLNYTEPLWKHTVLGVSYGLSGADNTSLQSTFNRGDGKYTAFVDSLSNDLKSKTIVQNTLVNLQGSYARFSYTLGGTLLQYHYRQHDLLTDSSLQYHYANFAPRALARFTLSPLSSVYFNYTANTEQPTVGQLQTIRNNSDPLHLVLGNPDLRPTLTQSVGLGYRLLRPFVLNVNANFGITSNSISTRVITDSLGRQISQPVNVGGARNAGIYFTINHKIDPWGVDAGWYTNVNYTHSLNYVNAALSLNDTYIYTSSFNLAKNVPDRYSVQLRAEFNYFYNRSSVDVAAPTHYWSQLHTASASFFPFRGLEVNTNLNYNWQAKTSVFGKPISVLIWNASVGRDFLSNQLSLRLSMNNLLNENAGIYRVGYGNTNTESSSHIMGRYWMVSAVYHFDHKMAKK